MYEGPADRVATIAELQRSLNFLGGNVGKVDNIFGPRTELAIKKFEKLSRLPLTGRPSPTIMAAVQAVYLALGGP
jgi:peptidoglycan hydrolase-like protein with peptidoglycan-binding domain